MTKAVLDLGAGDPLGGRPTRVPACRTRDHRSAGDYDGQWSSSLTGTLDELRLAHPDLLAPQKVWSREEVLRSPSAVPAVREVSVTLLKHRREDPCSRRPKMTAGIWFP